MKIINFIKENFDVVFIFIAMGFLIFFISGCSQFEVKEYSKIKQENLVYNVMSLYGNSSDKKVVEESLNLYYKYLHRDQCRIDVFGEKEKVDYNDYKKLSDYKNCLLLLKK